MLSMDDRQRVGKIRVLALYSEQAAIAKIFSETSAEISQTRATRSLERTIICVRITNILGECRAGSASAAHSAVENSNFDLRNAETKLVKHRRAECMGITNRNLSGVTYFIACPEAGRRQTWKEIRTIRLKILSVVAAGQRIFCAEFVIDLKFEVIDSLLI